MSQHLAVGGGGGGRFLTPGDGWPLFYLRKWMGEFNKFYPVKSDEKGVQKKEMIRLTNGLAECSDRSEPTIVPTLCRSLWSPH